MNRLPLQIQIVLLRPAQQQHLIDQMSQTPCLLTDTMGKILPILSWQIITQQLGAGIDGSQRAFELMSQGLHGLLNVGLASQPGTHIVNALYQVI